MKLTLNLATANAHKVRELTDLARRYPPAASGSGEPSPDQSGVVQLELVVRARLPQVVEDTGTFIGNARKKALALKLALPPDAWVLADDSGLGVDALHGGPGVESAYFAGPQADWAANLRKLVEVMRDVPASRRQAHFQCVLVLLGPDGVEQVFEGRCDGTLAREPAGAGGFGYDPVFIPDGLGCTYAELGAEEKNRISHRSRAWRMLIDWLRIRPATTHARPKRRW